MRPMRRAPLFLIAALAAARPSPSEANLLRNASFKDDWLTLLPENQNHHWCYATGFQNRRDYNPDTWTLSGSWKWLNAEGSRENRHLVLSGPLAEVSQRINWVLVHDDRKREGFPDAGGFPAPAVQKSRRPLALVRNLTLRARVRGQNVPKGAGRLELTLAPPGGITADDPLGAKLPPTVSAATTLPPGTYPFQWIEVELRAEQWLKAVESSPDRGATEGGVPLPGVAGVSLRYQSSSGQVEVDRVELHAADPESPNLLAEGSFDAARPDGWPAGWTRPEKYTYFPPALYYLFNTWHNAPFSNRGLVARDALLLRTGAASLKMLLPAGDEVQVATAPIVLNQSEARLIEVSAWIRTDQLNMVQIDGLNERGERLDGFNFIHKAPVSVGTEGWREIRQVFKPRRPVQALRLVLAARGVNGSTLDDTGETPQGNAAGSVWWDDVRVFEPESTGAELAARGVRLPAPQPGSKRETPFIEDLDTGEPLFGANTLTATVVNSGSARSLSLVFRLTTANGRRTEARSPLRAFAPLERATVSLAYDLPPASLKPYSEHKAEVSLVDQSGAALGLSELRLGSWTSPIDLEVGSLYLAPEQKQFVRLNLGFTQATLASVATVRLDLIRRGTGAIVSSASIPADAKMLAAQRDRIPPGLREDFTNLLLADLDVSVLPVQPFGSPDRNWFIRATVLDDASRTVFVKDSAPFCRLDKTPVQAAVGAVRLDNANLLYVNDKPFLPWAAVYGHVPVFSGPAWADGEGFRDLKTLPRWSIYDGFTSAGYTRKDGAFNATRYVAGSITERASVEKAWSEDNRIAATAFVAPGPVYSLEELSKAAGGRDRLASHLAFVRSAPMVVSTAPGIEEGFGLFHQASAAQIAGLESVVQELRRLTGKPVMVGHGGYWNRFEFEKVPFFDIYDPETEPLYPANLHTDLAPLLKGKPKTIWLRPQMYEDVPYERWRFHAYVELMRGARGFQIAHGPGDPSLFRGLDAELESLKPVLWSTIPGPEVKIAPAIEHWTRRVGGRAYVIAATTRGMTFGKWRWQDGVAGPWGRARLTEGELVHGDESNSYGIGQPALRGPALHGIQYLPSARAYPRGSRLVQWVRLDPTAMPRNLIALVKADGRFTHAGAYGPWNVNALRNGAGREWWLRSLYRHAGGFLGFGSDLLDKALDYLPERGASLGGLPEPGAWTKLEVRLSDLGVGSELVDGVAFMHEGGRVLWGRTSIEDATGAEVLWGDALAPSPQALERTRIQVDGLKAGTRIRVLFEDREIVAGAGSFIDDFRGHDLYQRFGGGPTTGYGSDPVAFHIYEIP